MPKNRDWYRWLVVGLLVSLLVASVPVSYAQEDTGEPADQSTQTAAPVDETAIPEPDTAADTTASEPVQIDSPAGAQGIDAPQIDLPPPPPDDEPPPTIQPPATNQANPATFLRGLKGEFQTQLFTGAATFSIPIATSPGRRGIEPDLALNYSHHQTRYDSLFGYGWDLSLGSVFRSTRKGVNNLYTEGDFTLELDGSNQELIVVDAATGVYGVKDETSFPRIIFANNQWTMTDRQGVQYTFGADLAGRQTDPTDSSRVYKWLLQRVEDQHGNFMTITYFKDQGQIYPDTIRYTQHQNQAGIYEVQFVRELRDTPYVSYMRGFETNTRYQISQINTFLDTGTPQLINRVNLTYTPLNGAIVHLTQVQETAGAEVLPPFAFAYYDGSESEPLKKIALLETVTYPYGAVETLKYKPATAYRLPDGSLANSRTWGIYTLHETHQQPDPSGPTHVTRYTYAGGHFFYEPTDAYTREQAGFHIVTVTDPVGNVKKMHFHQSQLADDNAQSVPRGEYEDHLSKKGRIYREEQYDDQDNLYQLTIRQWDKVTLSDQNPERDRFFPFLVREVVATYDGDQDYKATARTFSYDQYGNVIREEDYGEVTLTADDGSFTDVGTDFIQTDTTYAENTTDYLVAYPSQVQRSETGGTVIGRQNFYYDSAALGTVTHGDRTKTETLVDDSGTLITTQRGYNGFGLPVTFINARNHQTTVTYDAHELFMETVTNAKNHTTSAVYDLRFGIPTTVTDPNGAKTITTLDDFGRAVETQVSDPANPSQTVSTVTYSYDLAAHPVSLTQNRDFQHDSIITTQRTYLDGLGRTLQVRTEAQGADRYHVVSTAYDARGNVEKAYLPMFSAGLNFASPAPNGVANVTTYDPLNRPLTITNVLGTTVFDYDDWSQTVTDPNGNRKDLVSDSRGNLITVREYEGSNTYETHYIYDRLKNLINVTAAQGNIRQMTYDLLGRRLTETMLHRPGDTTVGSWAYVYDPHGNLTRQTDPRGQIILRTYDQLDRLLTEEYDAAAGAEVTLTYDQGLYGLGRLAQTVSDITKNFAYDILGRVTQEERIVDGETFALGYGYGIQGNLRSVTYPDTTQALYRYDNAGQIVSLTKDTAPVIDAVAYTPTGAVQQMDFANGVTTTNLYDIDKLYRLTNRLTTHSGQKLQSLTYTYDPVGNILTIVDDSDTNTAKTSTYTYDDLYRLTGVAVTGSANGQDYTRSYSYDSIGNLLTRSDAAGTYVYAGNSDSTSTATNVTPHAVTQIGSTVYTYDDNGNLISNGTWTHTWDAKNRLVSSTDGSQTVAYTYDETGDRALKHNTTAGKKTVYIDKYYDREGNTEKLHLYVGGTKVATEEK